MQDGKIPAVGNIGQDYSIFRRAPYIAGKITLYPSYKITLVRNITPYRESTSHLDGIRIPPTLGISLTLVCISYPPGNLPIP